MSLLILSTLFESDTAAAFPLLLLATAFLGVGFGLTVPALNTLTAAFHPHAVDSSVLVLNALLGLGTALAPMLVAIFVGLGFWWGLPLGAAIAIAILLGVSVRLPLRVENEAAASNRSEHARTPARFFVFAAFALGYGVCETMNGNWASLDMKDLGASTTVASLALTAFWGCVTLGRVGVAAIRRWVPTRRSYLVLPMVLAVAFLAIAQLPHDQPVLGILAFG